MTAIQTLEAQAAALKAVNIAKHKSAGKKFRIEVQVFGIRGAYKETKVYYTEDDTESRKFQVITSSGSKCISKSYETMVVEAI